MTYPSDIYEQRPLENLPGLEYDPLNNKTLFAEDILRLGREIEQIEDTLGLNLSNIEDLINYIVDGKLESKWPIGTAYINFSDSTNPAELLGFGTWELDSQGRVLVGKAASGTFGTIGATVGSETHTLTTAQMPSHTHGIGTLWLRGNAGAVDSNATNLDDFPGSNGPIKAYNQNIGNSWAGALANTGGGGAHNNIQPSLVVYIWRRTA